jgi:prepilin-type N-terminal cleavage/methylation domain-containing protein
MEAIMKREAGFSLLELLTVVVIIGVIAALAVPGLRRARQNASAGSAIQSLRTITTAQHLYERKFKVYASLEDIGDEGTIDSHLSNGEKSGYTFVMTTDTDPNSFTCTATPLDEPAVSPHFFVDETAIIRFNNGAPADVTSEPIPR